MMMVHESKNAEALPSCLNLVYESKFTQGLFLDNHTYIILYLCIYLIHMYNLYLFSLGKIKESEKSVKNQLAF